MKSAIRIVGLILCCATPFVLATDALRTRADDYFPPVSYRLTDGSTYKEGCFDPCDCPIPEEQMMTGTFDLVFYPFAGPVWAVGIEHVAWSVPALGRNITGQGIYRRAGDQQNLSLELPIAGEAPRGFDSGWVAGGDSYPFIDVTLSMNGPCYNIVLHVRAKPVIPTPQLFVDDAQLSWSTVPAISAYDVVCGNLTALRANGGDFGATAQACLASALPDTVLAQDVAVETGGGVWFLVRPAGGSYDSGDLSQVRSRDDGIPPAIWACP